MDDLDVAKPFEVKLRICLDGMNHSLGKVSVGIGWNTGEGLRVGGYNNLSHSVSISAANLLAKEQLEVAFCFAGGMPALAPGAYSLICGVHDQDVSRNIWTSRVASIHVRNGTAIVNADKDIISFGKFVTDVTVQYLTR